jgi:hypothetical protein
VAQNGCFANGDDDDYRIMSYDGVEQITGECNLTPLSTPLKYFQCCSMREHVRLLVTERQ